MNLHNTRRGGALRFVLPRRIGAVQTGVEIEDFWHLLNDNQ